MTPEKSEWSQLTWHIDESMERIWKYSKNRGSHQQMWNMIMIESNRSKFSLVICQDGVLRSVSDTLSSTLLQLNQGGIQGFRNNFPYSKHHLIENIQMVSNLLLSHVNRLSTIRKEQTSNMRHAIRVFRESGCKYHSAPIPTRTWSISCRDDYNQQVNRKSGCYSRLIFWDWSVINFAHSKR